VTISVSVSVGETIAIALGSTDAEERRQATMRIGELTRAPDAVPLLVRALGDEDWRVRKEATVAARAFGDAPELVAAMMSAIDGTDVVGLRNAAVEVLGAAGAGAARAIESAWASFDADARKLALEALGRTRNVAARATLDLGLGDRDPNVRAAAIEALASLGASGEPVEATLLSALDDRDPVVVLTALDGLTSLGARVPWSTLAPLVEQPMVRSAAIAAAASSGSVEAAVTLARLLPKSRGASFTHAMHALARLGETLDEDLEDAGRARAQIAEALRDGGADLGARLVAAAREGSLVDRRAALDLAVLSGAPRAVEVAAHALGEDPLNDAAARALVRAGARALPELLSAMSDASASAEWRSALVDVAATIGDALLANDLDGGDDRKRTGEHVANLRQALRAAARDAVPSVAASALLALARHGEVSDLTLVAVQTLADDATRARAAEETLSALAGRFPAAARAEARAMRSQDAFFLPASILLGAAGSSEAPGAPNPEDIAFLARAATSGELEARRAATEAAATLGGPGALEIVRLALMDEEHDVRFTGARSLGYRVGVGDLDVATLELVADAARDATDLLPAAVRAIGEGALARRPKEPLDTNLLAALSAYIADEAAVALAAIDALGALLRRDARAVAGLTAAIDRADADVARAALLRLPLDLANEAIARGLTHASADVRALAQEMLADAKGAR
jgi:HEAT repeat protein